jgi:hypothetical protein
MRLRRESGGSDCPGEDRGSHHSGQHRSGNSDADADADADADGAAALPDLRAAGIRGIRQRRCREHVLPA